MKKLFSLAGAILLTGSLFAGGLVTNTNLSAIYTRMQCRDATLGVDAAYFNPAGLTKLSDGIHLSISNQTLGQTRTVTSTYPFLADAPETKYEGKVSAPLFPSVYAVYKTGKWAFSAGFNVIGGGGGATYDDGLPSFEIGAAEGLVGAVLPSLIQIDNGMEASLGVNPELSNLAADADISFEGSSAYFGYQANASYAINDMISVSIGGRYVVAKDKYTGSLKDIAYVASPNEAVVPGLGGTYLPPGDYLRAIAALPGIDPTTAATLNGTAPVIDGGALAGEAEIDVEFSASGFTPIIGVNIAPSEKLNIALKYEHQTSLEMETKIIDGKDGGGMYVDGAKKIADMPGQITAGVMYKPMSNLMITTGVHYYLDDAVDYDGSEDIDEDWIDANMIEYALGLEYGINDQLRVSGGWLTTITGVNDLYQDGISYSLPSNTFGAGIGFKLNEMLDLSLGGSYTIYTEGSVDRTSSTTGVDYKTTFDKDVWIVSVGLDFTLGGGAE